MTAAVVTHQTGKLSRSGGSFTEHSLRNSTMQENVLVLGDVKKTGTEVLKPKRKFDASQRLSAINGQPVKNLQHGGDVINIHLIQSERFFCD